MKFTKNFWTANVAEMLDRMSYYAIFVVITLYLSNILGFSDIEASLISGAFSGAVYLLPMFMGAYADKIGFRRALIAAFILLPAGYLSLGLLPYIFEGLGLVSYATFASGAATAVANLTVETSFSGLQTSSMRWLVVPVMLIIAIGGAFVRSCIRASVARETTTENRARAYPIYYMLVNIGAFSGKSIVDPLRSAIGEQAYIIINFFSVALALTALAAVALFYHTTRQTPSDEKPTREILRGLASLLTNRRLMILILISTGFWTVQQQLYATMPKYVIRMAGEAARPGWIANVNPLAVVLLVNSVTRLMARRSALTSMAIGMFLIPVAALVMSLGNIPGAPGSIAGFHPVTLTLVAGIVIQGISECFISPRYLEYFSLHTPKGQEGMYLGFSQIDSFFSSILGFGLSGVLLSRYCPDPKLFPSRDAWLAASSHAHYIWYYFAAIGAIAALALVIFAAATRHSDSSKQQTTKA